jgi:putative hydrolase of the HAD superfamily
MLNLPKGILFDFGNTIFHEISYNADLGNKYLLENNYNPHKITFDQIKRQVEHIGPDINTIRYSTLIEHSWTSFTKLVYENYGMSVSDQNNEINFWDKSMNEFIAPGITQLLILLRKLNIKTGIVSNNSFNGKTLEHELSKYDLLQYFNFVISSADYGIRKPHPFIFELAINKLGFNCEDIWFIGDSIENDFNGSKKVGMVPFLYTTNKDIDFNGGNKIKQWNELIELIKDIEIKEKDLTTAST